MERRFGAFGRLLESRLKNHLVYTRLVRGREGTTCPLPDWLDEQTLGFLRRRRITALYLHQAEGLRLLSEGVHLIVTTPTGSGKTLIYNAHAAATLARDPSARALYLFPTKALCQDQMKTLAELNAFSAAIYDGDTGEDERRRIRSSGVQCILSNPDMLHVGILPRHDRWSSFFAGLRLVVIDEAHVYRGIFGSQVSHVIRRLRRICREHGSQPQFVLSSATMHKPEEYAAHLTGLPFSSVTDNTAPTGDRFFLFVDPLDTSPYTLAVETLRCAADAQLSTIAFTRSRRATELLQMWVSGRMSTGTTVDSAPVVIGGSESYRAGYLAEERRKIERALFSGTLKTVITTSALELGIDIGSLDCCVLFGWPGSVTSTWQRIGRVGRGRKDSAVVFIAQQDPLDMYFLRHPDEFFTRSVEDVIINPSNEIIARHHLACASMELPLSENDRCLYPPGVFSLVDRPGSGFGRGRDGIRYYLGAPPHQDIGLRSMGRTWTIVDAQRDEIIGEIDDTRLFFECHPGAIYLHQARKYEVLSLNEAKREVIVSRTHCDWYTIANWSESIEILNLSAETRVGSVVARAGVVEVTVQTVSYEKRKDSDKTLLALVQLSVPSQTLRTEAVWFELPPSFQKVFAAGQMDFHGGLHGIEHAIIGIFPLRVSCDRWDIGGYSFPFHRQTGSPAVFIYDGYPGGIGICQQAFGMMGDILAAAHEVIERCPCESGCPSCIQSPKCGSGNRPLDKKAAARLLQMILSTSR